MRIPAKILSAQRFLVEQSFERPSATASLVQWSSSGLPRPRTQAPRPNAFSNDGDLLLNRLEGGDSDAFTAITASGIPATSLLAPAIETPGAQTDPALYRVVHRLGGPLRSFVLVVRRTPPRSNQLIARSRRARAQICSSTQETRRRRACAAAGSAARAGCPPAAQLARQRSSRRSIGGL